MIRANNPEIDFEILNERVRIAATRLRQLNIVAERYQERTDGDTSSPKIALSRYRSVDALLDHASDVNRPKTRLPLRLAKIERMAGKSTRFALKVFNRIFRQTRQVTDIQLQALRELSAASQMSTRRILELEREIEELRRLIEP